MRKWSELEMAVYREHDRDCPYADPWSCHEFTNALRWAKFGMAQLAAKF